MWRALSNVTEFNTWFRTDFVGEFAQGRRFEAFRDNEQGWIEQLQNVTRHVESA